jgi:hypothetical protein
MTSAVIKAFCLTVIGAGMLLVYSTLALRVIGLL